MWLKVSSSYKELEIFREFYLDAPRQLRSIPEKVNGDGAKHAIIEPIHTFL